MKNKKQPFFAKFLENQVKNAKEIKGGDPIVTSRLKDAPNTTLPISDTAQTMKYPSDSDEGETV